MVAYLRQGLRESKSLEQASANLAAVLQAGKG